jgi:hypothetical protein
VRISPYDLTDDAARQAFYDQHGFTGDARRVPKIWVRDTNGQSRHLGGYTELAQHLERR